MLLLNKGKRGLGRLIFGRTGIILMLLAVQVGLLLMGFFWLGDYFIYGSSMLLALVVVLTVVNKPSNPAVKITWIILIMLAPVFAVPFYFFLKLDLGHRLARSVGEEIARRTAQYAPPETSAELRQQAPELAGLASYMERTNRQAFCRNSDVKYLSSGERYFKEILRQLEQAEKFIFLEYFIIEEGYMWGRILKLLERKAQEGVEVRVLYDGTCVIGKLPYRYPQQLEELGIRCRMYAPLRPLVSTYYNNRDRKSVV